MTEPVIIDTIEKGKAFEDAFIKAEEFAKYRKVKAIHIDDKPSENFLNNFKKGQEEMVKSNQSE